MENPVWLSVPEATPSLNSVVNTRPQAYRKARRHWHWLIKKARLDASIWAPDAPARARVRIERHVKQQRHLLDEDNFVGGCKPLLDALKKEGFLIDDDHVHLVLEAVQIVSSARRTEIRISAAPPILNA